MRKKKIWERIGPISKADRSFDIKFWQAQGARVRFRAAWEMTLDHYKIKDRDPDKLRLQKSVEKINKVKSC